MRHLALGSVLLLCTFSCGGRTASFPTAPQQVVAVVESNAVALSWVDVAGSAESFLVERKSGAEAFVSLTPGGIFVAEFRDAALTPGVTYTWRIRSVNTAGVSDASAEVTGQLASSATGGGVATGGGAAVGGGNATGGGGGTQLRAGDVLQAEAPHQEADITLPLDTEICLDVSVLHADGTRSKVVPQANLQLAVTSNQAGVVTQADPGDCAQVGFIASTVGVTGVTITASEGALSLTAQVVATVQAGALSLVQQPAYTLVVGEQSWGDTRGWSLWRDSTGHQVSDAQLVQKWVNFTVANSQFASVTARPPPLAGYWSHRGLAAGSTTVTMSYTAPHNTLSKTQTLTVIQKPTVSAINVEFVTRDGDRLDFRNYRPGVCFVPRATGTAQVGSLWASFDISSSATWSTESEGAAVVTPGAMAGEKCITGNGVTFFTACLDGVCGSMHLGIFENGAVTGVELTGASLSGSTVVPLDDTEGHNIFCPKVHAKVVLQNGSRVEVNRPAGWNITTSSFSTDFLNGAATIGPSPWGAFTTEAPVTPCFSIMARPMHYWSKSAPNTTFTLKASYMVPETEVSTTATVTVEGHLVSL